MATETLEQKTLDVERILNGFEKALRSKNPDKATDRIRGVVSRAECKGKIGYDSLVYLTKQTQKLVEKYGRRPYSSEN